RLPIERWRQHHGLAGVPDDCEWSRDDVALEDALEDTLQHCLADALPVQPVRKVAIGTVQIAEGCGLDDEQVERAPRWGSERGIHGRAPGTASPGTTNSASSASWANCANWANCSSVGASRHCPNCATMRSRSVPVARGLSGLLQRAWPGSALHAP